MIWLFFFPNRELPPNLMGKLSQLESMVKVLQDDLKKASFYSHKLFSLNS